MAALASGDSGRGSAVSAASVALFCAAVGLIGVVDVASRSRGPPNRHGRMSAINSECQPDGNSDRLNSMVTASR